MKLRNTSFGLALATAMGALAPTSNVGAVNLATDGIGEVAIAPYYTTRNNWLTLINLTNVTPFAIVVKVRIHEGMNSRDVLDFNVAMSANDSWTAVIQLNAAGNPEVNIQDADTCVIPQTNPKPLSVLGFSGNDDRGNSNADGGPTSPDRLREGYVEFIVMGYTDVLGDNNPLTVPTVLQVGEAIQEHQCAVVSSAFNAANILTTARQFGEPRNALKFNFRFLNAGAGMEAGGQATSWANFWNGTTGAGGVIAAGVDGNIAPADNVACTIDRGAERRGATDWNPADANTLSCKNLITAQVPFDFLEPSLNDAFPVAGNWWDDSTNAPISIVGAIFTAENRVVTNRTETVNENRGADALSMTIQRATAINEWALNSQTGTDTSWIITFPTKTFFVDKGDARQFGIWAGGDRHETTYDASPGDAILTPPAGVGALANGQNPPYPPFADAFLPYRDSATGPTADGKSCNDVSFTPFNREQESIIQQGGVIDSPAPAAPVDQLCFEVNVIDFSLTGAPSPGVFGSSLVTMAPGLSALDPNLNGWMELNLTSDPAAQSTVLNVNPNALPTPIPGGLGGFSGLPTIGFMMKHRDLGDPTTNFSSSIDHAWRRSRLPLPLVPGALPGL